MNNLMGTKTDQNLRFAFSGESEARNKYTFFASAAKKDGYEQIALFSRKLPTTKRNTPKCGLRRYPEWAQIPLKI